MSVYLGYDTMTKQYLKDLVLNRGTSREGVGELLRECLHLLHVPARNSEFSMFGEK